MKRITAAAKLVPFVNLCSGLIALLAHLIGGHHGTALTLPWFALITVAGVAVCVVGWAVADDRDRGDALAVLGSAVLISMIVVGGYLHPSDKVARYMR